MNRVLVIGYGNLLRGDDGIGWVAAELLATHLPQARVLTTHQLTPELSEAVSEASFVVFLDAFAQGEPGTIHCETLIPDTGVGVITHHATPTALLTMARHLYGRCPPAVMLSMSGLSFDYSDSLSPLVHHMLPALIEQACAVIQGHITHQEEEWEIEPCMNTQ